MRCWSWGLAWALFGFLAAGSAFAQTEKQAENTTPSQPSLEPNTKLTPSPETPPIPEKVVDPLQELVEKAIQATARRQLTAGVHSPWQVVHGILALRQDFILTKPGGGEIRGVDWMASGATYDGLSLFEVTPYGGRGRPFTRKYAFEGHPTQFLGYMAMADLPLDFEFQAGSKKITVKDILNDAKMQVREGPEVTWTLWAMAHYIDPNEEWINAYREPWSVERMVQIQTNESVLAGACGGTHGLFVLAYARNQKLARGEQLSGVWLAADQKVKRFVAEARALQNHDGSFSSSYFRGRTFSNNFTQRLPANGHTLEFLMIALSDRELKDPWVLNAVKSVATDLIENRKVPADCGPLYHALHSLILYKLRTDPEGRTGANPLRKETPLALLPKPTENTTTPEVGTETKTPEPVSIEPKPAPEPATKEVPKEEKPAATEPPPAAQPEQKPTSEPEPKTNEPTSQDPAPTEQKPVDLKPALNKPESSTTYRSKPSLKEPGKRRSKKTLTGPIQLIEQQASQTGMGAFLIPLPMESKPPVVVDPRTEHRNTPEEAQNPWLRLFTSPTDDQLLEQLTPIIPIQSEEDTGPSFPVVPAELD